MYTDKFVYFRRAVTLCLLFVISIGSSMVILAESDKSLAGEIVVSGRSENGEEAYVMLNGERVFSGRTFFSGSLVATAENAAVVKLGKLGYLELAPNSTLDLKFADGSIAGKLSAGDVRVFNAENVVVNIENAPNASAQQQQSGGVSSKVWIPVAIIAGAVAVVAIVALAGGDDDDVVSPVR
jgi:hypothetical protein